VGGIIVSSPLQLPHPTLTALCLGLKSFTSQKSGPKLEHESHPWELRTETADDLGGSEDSGLHSPWLLSESMWGE
jgi:hypothetical protein